MPFAFRPLRLAALALLAAACSAAAGGVTVITHGFNSDVETWIIPMAEEIPGHPAFSGTNASCYKISISKSGGQFVHTAEFLAGVRPDLSDSGEIFVKLDWSSQDDFFQASTPAIAEEAVNALTSGSLIPELGGGALAELPLHLVGHSRGGSVVTEMARLLGAQGIWVDHVTTLDPRPVNIFGLNDAPVRSWENVLYADNYWQDLGNGLTVPNGQFLPGAHNRKLLDLSEGYGSTHSNVHLWYHGTIDHETPTDDTQAFITQNEREAWWTTPESEGTTAGFHYSRLGGGDRLSTDSPAGGSLGRILDGFNQNWDLGAGLSPNRDSLPANSGDWPNLIRSLLTGPRQIPAGERFELSLYHQSGSAQAGQSGLQVLLDPDRNPWNGNEIEIQQAPLDHTGTGSVGLDTLDLTTDPGIVPPGTYAVLARISDGGYSRLLYTPEVLEITPPVRSPSIEPGSFLVADDVVRFTVLAQPGQTVTVRGSTDLIKWEALQTHFFTTTSWEFAEFVGPSVPRRFYQPVLEPGS